MKSDSFQEFLTIWWAKESETTSACLSIFTCSMHTTLRLAESRLSDLTLLGGRADVTEHSQVLTECSPFVNLIWSVPNLYNTAIVLAWYVQPTAPNKQIKVSLHKILPLKMYGLSGKDFCNHVETSVPWPVWSLGAHEGWFSRDPLSSLSAGGLCEQCWHGQG